jgi:hypothetical protein
MVKLQVFGNNSKTVSNIPVVSEELIKMWKVNGRTDGRRTLSGDNSSPDPLGQVS